MIPVKVLHVSLCVFLNLRYSSKYSAQIYRAQYEAAMLVYLRETPTWRPENSATVLSLLHANIGRYVYFLQRVI